MTLSELIKEYGSQAKLAKALDCDKSYLNRVVLNRRPLGPALAVKIYQVTGHKLGPMAERAA